MRNISTKIVKTRKPHVCFACGRMFKEGTEMKSDANVYEGRIYSLYTCEICDELLTNYPDEFIGNDDMFPEGCVYERLNEFNIKTPEELLEQLTKQQ